MSPEAHLPLWEALREELDALVRATPDGLFAAVLDESKLLWCWSRAPGLFVDCREDVLPVTDRFHATEIASLACPLRRGGQLSISRRAATVWDSYAAESFAGLYVLVVWFEGSEHLSLQRPRLQSALPRIEALTIALPPPGGPDATAGAAKGRA